MHLADTKIHQHKNKPENQFNNSKEKNTGVDTVLCASQNVKWDERIQDDLFNAYCRAFFIAAKLWPSEQIDPLSFLWELEGNCENSTIFSFCSGLNDDALVRKTHLHRMNQLNKSLPSSFSIRNS